MKTLIMPTACPACSAHIKSQHTDADWKFDNVEDEGSMVEHGRFAQYDCGASLSAHRNGEHISRVVQASCTHPDLHTWASEA